MNRARGGKTFLRRNEETQLWVIEDCLLLGDRKGILTLPPIIIWNGFIFPSNRLENLIFGASVVRFSSTRVHFWSISCVKPEAEKKDLDIDLVKPPDSDDYSFKGTTDERTAAEIKFPHIVLYADFFRQVLLPIRIKVIGKCLPIIERLTLCTMSPITNWVWGE